MVSSIGDVCTSRASRASCRAGTRPERARPPLAKRVREPANQSRMLPSGQRKWLGSWLRSQERRRRSLTRSTCDRGSRRRYAPPARHLHRARPRGIPGPTRQLTRRGSALCLGRCLGSRCVARTRSRTATYSHSSAHERRAPCPLAPPPLPPPLPPPRVRARPCVGPHRRLRRGRRGRVQRSRARTEPPSMLEPCA